jgi:hypothetical protein
VTDSSVQYQAYQAYAFKLFSGVNFSLREKRILTTAPPFNCGPTLSGVASTARSGNFGSVREIFSLLAVQKSRAQPERCCQYVTVRHDPAGADAGSAARLEILLHRDPMFSNARDRRKKIVKYTSKQANHGFGRTYARPGIRRGDSSGRNR